MVLLVSCALLWQTVVSQKIVISITGELCFVVAGSGESEDSITSELCFVKADSGEPKDSITSELCFVEADRVESR